MPDEAAKPQASPTAFPVSLDGRWLWVAWARSGIVRRLFASKAAAEAEAAAYDEFYETAEEWEIAARYAAPGGQPDGNKVRAFWWCEDLDGAMCVVVEAPWRAVFQIAARRKTDILKKLAALGREARGQTRPQGP